MARIKATTDTSTEEKIKDAAREVFTRKGYAATRTRDIAEAAGMNLALLNYYFRSKEKLFELVMLEKVQQLFSVIAPVMNETATSLESKISRIVVNYMDMLLANPDLPLFVLSEIRRNPQQLGSKLQAGKLLNESVLVQQLRDRRPDVPPLQYVMSLLGMTLFPFVGKPIFTSSGGLSSKDFESLIEQRKKLIPAWITAMLDTA